MAPRPRAAVAALAPYHWEESTESIAARLGLRVSDVVRFDTNTVPWEPSVSFADADDALNEYPDTSYGVLVSAVSAYCGRGAAEMVVGAGADELISLVAQAYLEPGRRCLVSDPTYPVFALAARIAGAEVVAVPTTDDVAVDRDALLRAAAEVDVAWLANPNNPTGELLPPAFLESLAAATRGLLVVDEAYFEFCGTSALPLLDAHANLVVIRTLSKGFGLAAMRVGYLLAHRDVVAVLNRLRPINSVTTVSARLAAEALAHADGMRAQVAALVGERGRLVDALRGLGVAVRDGAANFVLAGLEPAAVRRAESRGLVLRGYGAGHRLAGWSRITVRSPEENARLLAALGSA